MAEFAFTLTAAPILGGIDKNIGENRILERDDLALVSVATPIGGEDALTKTLAAAWELPLPEATVSAASGDMRAVRTAPDQLLLIFPPDTPDAHATVQGRLGGAGYTTDQTDVWVVLEVNGPQTLAALERLCPLDLYSFPDGGAGRTVMEHMGAMVVRLGADRFLLLSASSSAGSFLHAVETSFHYVTD